MSPIEKLLIIMLIIVVVAIIIGIAAYSVSEHRDTVRCMDVGYQGMTEIRSKRVCYTVKGNVIDIIPVEELDQ